MHSRFDTEARIAVAQATDIARELGHSEVGPDHLLLGLLANMRGTAYAALTDHGLRLDAARDLVAAHHVDVTADATDNDPAAEPDGLDEDREALRAIGIDLDRVREAVRENLGADLTSGWGARPERGRRGRARSARGERRERGERTERTEREERDEGDERGERRRGRGHHGHHHGRGRRGPRSARSDGPHFSAGLRDVLHDVRRSTLRDRLDRDADVRHGAPGMTGQRLVLALIDSDDTVVGTILATATDLDGLRARIEAEVAPTVA
jgi:ATP-dependent Clp protease ATP-binding subunit ClpA